MSVLCCCSFRRWSREIPRSSCEVTNRTRRAISFGQTTSKVSNTVSMSACISKPYCLALRLKLLPIRASQSSRSPLPSPDCQMNPSVTDESGPTDIPVVRQINCGRSWVSSRTAYTPGLWHWLFTSGTKDMDRPDCSAHHSGDHQFEEAFGNLRRRPEVRWLVVESYLHPHDGETPANRHQRTPTASSSLPRSR